jgi:hypothetical protein
MSAAGLLVRCQGQLAFIPAAVARFIRYDIVVTPFPGTELGMALLAGRIVPVVSLGPPGRALVVCDNEGETVAFSGIEPIKSGFFDGDERGPIEANDIIPTLPIRDLVEKARLQGPTLMTPVEEDSWMS